MLILDKSVHAENYGTCWWLKFISLPIWLQRRWNTYVDWLEIFAFKASQMGILKLLFEADFRFLCRFIKVWPIIVFSNRNTMLVFQGYLSTAHKTDSICGVIGQDGKTKDFFVIQLAYFLDLTGIVWLAYSIKVFLERLFWPGFYSARSVFATCRVKQKTLTGRFLGYLCLSQRMNL